MRFSRLFSSLAIVSLLGCTGVLVTGCSADAGSSESDDGNGQVGEEELRSEEESFAPL